MRELSLFTGAGGGLLGSLILGWRTVAAVEIDPYCQRVLCARGGYMADAGCSSDEPERVAGVVGGEKEDARGEGNQRQRSGYAVGAGRQGFPVYPDVRDFHPVPGSCDIVTGGFPCQPFSQAGKRLGEDDPRNMWPHAVRVLRESGAPLGFFENVPGLLSSGYFGTVLGDLCEAGFDAEWCVLGADDVGAPHRRKRLWILAVRHGYDAGMYARTVAGAAGSAGRDAALDVPSRRGEVSGGGADDVSDAERDDRTEGRRSTAGEAASGRAHGEPGGCSEVPAGTADVADAEDTDRRRASCQEHAGWWPAQTGGPDSSPWAFDPADVGHADDARSQGLRLDGERAGERAAGEAGAESPWAIDPADWCPINERLCEWRSRCDLASRVSPYPDATGEWESFTPLGRVAASVGSRVDRLRALGNGQVPLTMACAFTYLAEQIGR